MYYKLFMRDGEEAMPIKAPRMTRQEGIAFLTRRLNIKPVEFEMQNPFIVAQKLFDAHTILYDRKIVMNNIYKQLFGSSWARFNNKDLRCDASCGSIYENEFVNHDLIL